VFYKKDDRGYKEALEGIRLKTLVHGEKTLLCEFKLKGGKILPSHKHPHEQTGYLVTGHITLIIGDERFDAGPGDSWCIPKDIQHSAEVHEDSLAVEVFSPVREDYLP
jgi:quercetin dioxygenase-like cupin family protein